MIIDYLCKVKAVSLETTIATKTGSATHESEDCVTLYKNPAFYPISW